ncbi:MAG: bifunctional (p)ppGpp synthetase/guanosine-3',5'-bis(diphosphate) 3'-pyrophosphohydrolase [Clostridia bacterium]|nr:bifunctional (p)ppGpp synthetase/guanosine-3',5'-bis(diphosphate) 3'-pyrophosphohydrolase [Clostridia bacterium]
MIYTPMTIKAMKIAYQAHDGQLDYNQVPYIFHPVHLAEQMEDEISCTAALLHDVVEDTDVTFEDLRQEFPEEVIEVIRLLTHEDGVDYFDYVWTIAKHPIARKVKLEDLKHNSDQTRCVGSNLSEEKLRYWAEKYEKARRILLQE